MNVFATRVWGFDPEIWTVAGFGSEGICNNLIRASRAGDKLVFVGTKDLPTQPEHQGRILGYAEFGRDVHATLDVIPEDAIKPVHYDDKGQFRWPRGMVMTRAWKITLPELPDLVDTIGRQLPYNATTMAVQLSQEEAEAILTLPVTEVEMQGTDAYARIRRRTDALKAGGRSRGPVPSDRDGGEYRLGHLSFAYVMRYGTTNCFKVGRANDTDKRLMEMNKHVPSEITGAAWKIYMTEEFEDENVAHLMEQSVLDSIPQERITGERFRIDPMDLDILWASRLMDIQR